LPPDSTQAGAVAQTLPVIGALLALQVVVKVVIDTGGSRTSFAVAVQPSVQRSTLAETVLTHAVIGAAVRARVGADELVRPKVVAHSAWALFLVVAGPSEDNQVVLVHKHGASQPASRP